MVTKLNSKTRKKLMKIKPDEDAVLAGLEAGKTLWQITEEIYNFEFDHNDKKTWLFYQKVNNIRRKHDKPVNKARYVRVCPHCGKDI